MVHERFFKKISFLFHPSLIRKRQCKNIFKVGGTGMKSDKNVADEASGSLLSSSFISALLEERGKERLMPRHWPLFSAGKVSSLYVVAKSSNHATSLSARCTTSSTLVAQLSYPCFIQICSRSLKTSRTPLVIGKEIRAALSENRNKCLRHVMLFARTRSASSVTIDESKLHPSYPHRRHQVSCSLRLECLL